MGRQAEGLASSKRRQGSVPDGAEIGRGSGWNGGWGECSICPTPVSCSDTSFITGRKEAISVCVGGWRLQLHKGLAQPAPLPLLYAVGAREMMGRVAEEVSRPLQVKETHSNVYRYIYMPCIYVHVCIYTI